MACPKCGSGKLVKIKLTLHSEERVDFYSCPNCEHKWWEEPAGAERIALSEVLTRATVRKSA